MISRLIGALVRAILVVLLIAAPSMLLLEVSRDTAQIVTLIALFGAGLTFFEYCSSYPGLIEFRDAPPFNRIRYASLLITIVLLSFTISEAPSAVGEVVAPWAAVVGEVIDFPYSPVRLVVLMLPADATLEHVLKVRNSAGMAYAISLITLVTFAILQRVRNWPMGQGSFNVWINLPTFDPTAGGDVVERLERDARFNVALGFLLPFLTPAVIKSATSLFGAVTLENPQTLIWTVAAWAFLPASLFMRGIAMARIASMITQKRKESNEENGGNAGLLPV